MARAKASAPPSNKADHYIDNKEFYDAMSAYIAECRAVEAEGKDIKEHRPKVPNYIAECFMKISERLSYSPNFVNYTFKDEMICDGIENCLLYMHNFNPEKSKNPFAYFTQIIYYAFLRRIQKEKKQQYVKLKSFSTSMIVDDYHDTMDGDNEDYQNTFVEYLHDNVDKFLKDFEDSYLKKTLNKKNKKPKKKKDADLGLEAFSEDVNLNDLNSSDI